MQPQNQVQNNQFSRPGMDDIRKIKTPVQEFESIMQNTLDENMLETLSNQVKSTCFKFGYVLLPRSSDTRTRKLRNWDLWGPFAMAVVFGMFINSSQKFLLVVFTIMTGAQIVAFNVRILGGQISVLQSFAILGYCIFPLFVIMLILHFLRFVQFKNSLVKSVLVVVGVLWSVLAARAFIAANLPEDRKFVGLYPIIIFYIFVGFLLYYI